MNKTPPPTLWIGGVVCLLAVGLVRLAIRWFGFTGMVTSIALGTGLAVMVLLKYGLPSIHREDEEK